MPLEPHPLDRVRVARPCNSSWDLMEGDDRVRHCSNCSKDVYNVAGLSRDEAMDVITGNGGTVCMRLFRRPDGTLSTSDCAGSRAATPRSRLKVVAAVAVTALSVVGLGVWASF